MKTKRENLCLLLAVSLYFTFLAQVIAQNCPPCYNNRDPLINRWGYSQDSRQTTRFYIDETNMTPAQRTSAYQGANQAANLWNNATNGAQKVPYFLEPGGPTDTDFIIRLGMPAEGCVQIDTSVYPHVIIVSANQLAQNLGEVAGAFAHEFGHRYGLDDTNCRTSIMSPQTNCRGVSNVVSATDVAQANTSFDPSTRGTCTQAAPTTAYHEEGGGGAIISEEEIQQDPKGGDNCYDTWLVTHYYRCQGNRCTYLYSTWQYLGSDCY